MADPISAVAIGGGLFGYNRQNWMWDQTLRQKREYQGQAMNIKRFELYREDVRDLAELTISKMDNYLLINLLLMGFCVKIFTEGRPKPGASPSWLHWLYAATNSGALLYFMLSVWLAMHASVASHSFEVRLLTQFVRLPIPSKEQIDAARFHAQDFETKQAKDLFRVPVLSEMMRNLTNTMNNATVPSAEARGPLQPPQTGSFTASNLGQSAATLDSSPRADAAGPGLALSADPALEVEAAKLQHVKLYRQVQSNWQAYDAYARVSMAMGVNQLMSAMSYFCLIMFVGENRVTWPALCCTLAFSGCAYLLARLDLYVPRHVIRRTGILMAVPPLLSFIAIIADRANVADEMRRATQVCVPLCFAIHMYWIYFIISMARAEVNDGMALPLKFRSVLFLDVYGWIRSTPQRQRGDEAASGQSCPVVESSLAQACHEQLVRLEHELVLWETPDVQVSLLPQQVDMYRQCSCIFKRVQDDLRGQLLESEHADVLSREVPEDTSEIWLRLLHQQGSRTIIFYRRPHRDEREARVPEGAWISDLEVLRSDIAEWDRKVQQLKRMLVRRRAAALVHRGPPRPPEGAGSEGQASTLSPPPSSFPPRSPALSPGPCAAAGSAGDVTIGAATFPPAARRPTVPSQASLSSSSLAGLFAGAPHEEAGNPAQETRFGGREAVELSEVPRLLGAGAEAAATFAPETRDADAGREHLQRPPGHFPWMLFYQGSVFLMVIWAIGFVWCVLQWAIGFHISLKPLEVPIEGWEAFAGLPPRPSLAGSRGSGVEGLVCHEALGATLLVHERYTVHALRLDGLHSSGEVSASAAWDTPPLLECLRAAALSQDGGARGIAADCSGGACEAVLLAGDGRTLTRCSVRGFGSSSSPVVAANVTAAFGGPWRSFAVGRNGAAWGLREGSGALLELRPRRAGAPGAGWLPRLEVAPATEGLAALTAVGGGSAVLGLKANGQMHAWLLGSGRHLEWELPRRARWTGVCEAGDHLLLSGVQSTWQGSRFGLWRMPLPEELRATDAEEVRDVQRIRGAGGDVLAV